MRALSLPRRNKISVRACVQPASLMYGTEREKNPLCLSESLAVGELQQPTRHKISWERESAVVNEKRVSSCFWPAQTHGLGLIARLAKRFQAKIIVWRERMLLSLSLSLSLPLFLSLSRCVAKTISNVEMHLAWAGRAGVHSIYFFLFFK